MFSLGVPALGIVQQREAPEVHGHSGMIQAEVRNDRQRAFLEQLALRISACINKDSGGAQLSFSWLYLWLKTSRRLLPPHHCYLMYSKLRSFGGLTRDLFSRRWQRKRDGRGSFSHETFSERIACEKRGNAKGLTYYFFRVLRRPQVDSNHFSFNPLPVLR